MYCIWSHFFARLVSQAFRTVPLHCMLIWRNLGVFTQRKYKMMKTDNTSYCWSRFQWKKIEGFQCNVGSKRCFRKVRFCIEINPRISFSNLIEIRESFSKTQRHKLCLLETANSMLCRVCMTVYTSRFSIPFFVCCMAIAILWMHAAHPVSKRL